MPRLMNGIAAPPRPVRSCAYHDPISESLDAGTVCLCWCLCGAVFLSNPDLQLQDRTQAIR
jgi:hypothetical protein